MTDAEIALVAAFHDGVDTACRGKLRSWELPPYFAVLAGVRAAIAAAAHKGGDGTAPGKAPQSGAESASPND